MQNFRNQSVIIIGAGIGGLSAGIALKRLGMRVQVFDRVRELRPVGAGISLWSNGVKVINWLGLETEMAAIGGQMNRMQYRSAIGDSLNQIDLLPLIQTVGQRPYPVARRALQSMLRDAYTGDLLLDHTCLELQPVGDQVTAIFRNGHQETADFVIVADGVRSQLRSSVLGDVPDPAYVGYVNWNGLVPRSLIDQDPEEWVIYVGQHQRASLMPVGDEQFYFFFDVPLPIGTPNDPANYRSQLSQYFSGWADPVQQLIQAFDPSQMSRPEIHDFGPIDRLVKGRIAILGDAAHTTCPDLGQGGCQALEDVYVLTQALESSDTIEAALQQYEDRRLDRINSLVLKARQRAQVIHGIDPIVTQQWYEQLASEPPDAVRQAISSVILGAPL